MSPAVVGQKKAALARDHVRAVNPWTQIATVIDDIAALSVGHLAGLDAVILAVDNDHARFLASRLGLTARVPIVDAAVRADLFVARATICGAGVDESCVSEGWTEERLARAGEDVGVPCAGITGAPPYGSTLLMAQAGAALAVHQVLALAGITGEPAWTGNELRLDLHAGRLERFRRPRTEPCAADHRLASGELEPIDGAPADQSLGSLMTACGAGVDSEVVLATTELVHTAACTGCGLRPRPHRPLPLSPCGDCGGALVALRRVRRARWREVAPVVAPAPASLWFRAGDVFAIADDRVTRRFAFAPPPLPWEPGRAWTTEDGTERLDRLPRRYDLARIRATRLGLLGLGHLGAAILEALAPLPWAGLLLCDRDAIELHNLAAYPPTAGAPGGPG